MPKKVVTSLPKQPTKKVAAKIVSAHKKVQAYGASSVGNLRKAYDELTGLTRLLTSLLVNVDDELQSEVKLFLSLILRFRQKVIDNNRTRDLALIRAVQGLDAVEVLLESAQDPEVKKLLIEAERDITLLRQLRHNLFFRQREAAFVLAELEQAVDPVPEFKLATAKQRKASEVNKKVSEVSMESPTLKPEAEGSDTATPDAPTS